MRWPSKKTGGISSSFPACGFILLAAMAGAFLFNALMPQGIGFLPTEIKNPLWQPAPLDQAKALYDQRVLFVDARDPGKYKLGHVRGAVNLPPDEYKLIYPPFGRADKKGRKDSGVRQELQPLSPQLTWLSACVNRAPVKSGSWRPVCSPGRRPVIPCGSPGAGGGHENNGGDAFFGQPLVSGRTFSVRRP